MKNQEHQLPENATQAIHLAKCAVHKLANKKKQKVAEGSCRVYSVLRSSEDTPNQSYDSYYVKVKKTVIPILENMSFAVINYPETTSFLFEHNDGYIYAISFYKNCENLDKFQSQLNRIGTISAYNSDEIKPQLKQKISEASKTDIEQSDIWKDKSLIKSIGKGVGVFIGKISNVVMQPTEAAGKAISDRADRFSRDSVSETTKSKWNGITSTTDRANQSINNSCKPLVNKCEDIIDSLGKSFNSSENKIVAAIRQYSFALRDSLNQGEKIAMKKQAQSEQLKQQATQAHLNLPH